MRAMSALYGLIFDVDGVIADTEAVNARASIRVFADLFGVDGVKRKDFEKGLGRGAEEYIKAAAKVHSLELNNEQVLEATKLRQEYFLRILEDEPLAAFPGVLKLIEAALGRQDFRVAIATSSTREKSQAVLRSAMVPYEKMVYITSNEVKNKKPHPELFQKAVERLSISPDTCIVIEDTPPGVKAAKAVGCKCIAVTNSMTAEHLAEADVVVGSLEEVTIDSLVDLIRRNKR